MAKLLVFVSALCFVGVAAVALWGPSLGLSPVWALTEEPPAEPTPAPTTARRGETREVLPEPAPLTRPAKPRTPSTPANLESPMTRVVTHPAAVYSGNSSESGVLKLLDEGDRVEAGLELLTSEGRWTQVRLDGQTAGFIRSEDLSSLRGN